MSNIKNIFDIPRDFNNPNWNEKEKAHDWKNYVTPEVEKLWYTFNMRQRELLAINFQNIANDEEWN